MFLLFAHGTLTVCWFSGGLTFRIVLSVHIGCNPTTSISRATAESSSLGPGGVPEFPTSFSANHGYYRSWKQLTQFERHTGRADLSQNCSVNPHYNWITSYLYRLEGIE